MNTLPIRLPFVWLTPTMKASRSVLSSPARVVVADDHPICAELLPQLLERIGCTVVGVAQDGVAAVSLCEQLQPDVLLLDVLLPRLGGVEVLQQIRSRGLSTRVLLFTGSFSVEVLREAMMWGIDGCLVKTASIEEIEAAFRRVLRGEPAFGPEAAEAMRRIVAGHDDAAALTSVETTVLRMVAEGRAVKEMAGELALSESGIYKVLERVKRKIGAQSLQELTLSAVRRGLVAV